MKYVIYGLAVGGIAYLLVKNKAAANIIGSTAIFSDIWGEDYGADMNNINIKAFLMMIRTAEGTADSAGYTRMFGGKHFTSYADHPRQKFTATFKGGKTVTSSAAGAYQIIAGTWDGIRGSIGAKDFSPANQDKAAIALIDRRGALDDVKAGRFDVAISKCAKEWASLPGSPYGQPTITLARAKSLLQAYGATV